MNPIFTLASSPPTNSGFPNDFQDLCAQGVSRAWRMEMASLDMVVRLNSCALQMYRDALWFTPVFFHTALAFYMEYPMNWLSASADAPSRVVAMNSTVDCDAGGEDELAFSMDIAIGERFSTRDAQEQSAEEESTRTGDDIAIAMRAA